jgi:7-cyano-7-deazaguanine synthase
MGRKSALVLFSGGQDSSACLAWALNRFDEVHTIGFTYGQKHEVELEQRKVILAQTGTTGPANWASILKSDKLVSVGDLGKVADSALTDHKQSFYMRDNLPNTFLPGRNILFLTFAAAHAHNLGIHDLVGGMCETDFSGYPDCRRTAIDAIQDAVTLGMNFDFTIHTPLMFIDKAATWDIIEHIGGRAFFDMIVEESHTCYNGDRQHRHPWGYGCGECPACKLREAGWNRYMLSLPQPAA